MGGHQLSASNSGGLCESQEEAQSCPAPLAAGEHSGRAQRRLELLSSAGVTREREEEQIQKAAAAELATRGQMSQRILAWEASRAVHQDWCLRQEKQAWWGREEGGGSTRAVCECGLFSLQGSWTQRSGVQRHF